MRTTADLAVLLFVSACGGARGPGPDGRTEPVPTVQVARGGTIEERASVAPPDRRCPPQCIAGTDVADTASNREVIAFCERYRKAVEAKDVQALLSMASSNYHDDGGTTDDSDDMHYEDLAQFLQQHYAGIQSIRFEVRYRKIERVKSAIHVTMTYSGSFQLATGARKNIVSDSVLELEPRNGSFAIVRGM